jgi:hypothetical protein
MPSENPGKQVLFGLFPGAPIDYNIPEVWTLDSSYGRIKPMEDNETPKGLLKKWSLLF